MLFLRFLFVLYVLMCAHDVIMQVAHISCDISNDEEGVERVYRAADQLLAFCPHVINAARVLVARPDSKVS